eukprot:SAG22_NODE_855_length_6843_cov_3.865658_5_plen_348_part_00
MHSPAAMMLWRSRLSRGFQDARMLWRSRLPGGQRLLLSMTLWHAAVHSMSLKEDPRGWDSWLVAANGRFSLNYMAGPAGEPTRGTCCGGGSWNHVAGAQSSDGVHWSPQGMLYDSPPECCPPGRPACAAMGSGTTWKVISNTTTIAANPATYVAFFSSGRAGDHGSEGVYAVTSTDRLEWERRPDLTFKPDPNLYSNTSRWDGPSVVCKVDENPCRSGYFMALTASGKSQLGSMGLAESDTGLHWTALPPIMQPAPFPGGSPEIGSMSRLGRRGTGSSAAGRAIFILAEQAQVFRQTDGANVSGHWEQVVRNSCLLNQINQMSINHTSNTAVRPQLNQSSCVIKAGL